MNFTELENQIKNLLKQKLSALGALAEKYGDLIDGISEQGRDIIEGALIGDDIAEEKKFFDATIQQLVSASQAITVGQVKDTIKEAAGLMLQAALKTITTTLA